MDDKNYYSRKGYVSNSSLNYLSKSPKLFKKYIDGLIEESSKDYFRFGQLVHLKILEADEFEETVLVYDYITPKSAQQKSFIESIANFEELSDDILIDCYNSSYTTKESNEKIIEKAKKLIKTFETYFKYLKLREIKIIISTKEFDKIKEMETSCRAHKAAKDLLFDLPHPLVRDGEDSFNEHEVLWKYNKVKCKSLIDRHIVDYNNKVIKLVDFKTTAKLSDFKESFYNYNYDRQLAFYELALLYSLTDTIGPDLKNWTIESYIVACDTITHETKVFTVKREDIEKANKKIEKLLEDAEWHISNNKWDYSRTYHNGDGYEIL